MSFPGSIKVRVRVDGSYAYRDDGTRMDLSSYPPQMVEALHDKEVDLVFYGTYICAMEVQPKTKEPVGESE